MVGKAYYLGGNAPCHICGERGDVALGCANSRVTLSNGIPVCTRAICQGCFTEYGWDWNAAAADDSWTCTHCRDVCPRCTPPPLPASRGGNSLEQQLLAAEHQARYLACLKSISDAQPSQGAEPGVGLALVDKLASALYDDPEAEPEELAAAAAERVAAAARAAAASGGRWSAAAAGLAEQQAEPGCWPEMSVDGSVGGDVDPRSPARDAAGASRWRHHESGETSAVGLAAEAGVSEARLACWGSPAVSGDAWGHEGGAGAAVSVRTGSGGAIRAHHLIVLVGGRNDGDDAGGGRGFGTLVHVFEPEKRKWLRVTQAGHAPSRLRAHTATAFGDTLVLSGGAHGSGDGRRMSSELYTLQLSPPPNSADVNNSAVAGGSIVAAVAAVAGAAASAAAAAAAETSGLAPGLSAVHATWSHPQVRGTPPPPRVGACAARMGDESLVLFGGYASPGPQQGTGSGGGGGGSGGKSGGEGRSSKATGSYSNAIFALNVGKSAWGKPTVHLQRGAAPPTARLGASATSLHARELLLFGGSSSGKPCADLDLLVSSADLTEPHASLRVGQPTTQGTPPAPRYNHCAALLGHTELVVFGGLGGDGRQHLCDVGLLHVTTMRWSTIEFRGVPPMPRAAAIGAATPLDRRFWVFGGAAADGSILNDVHLLEVSRLIAVRPADGGGGALLSATTAQLEGTCPPSALAAPYGAAAMPTLGPRRGGGASAAVAAAAARAAADSVARAKVRPPPAARLCSDSHVLLPQLTNGRMSALGPIAKPTAPASAIGAGGAGGKQVVLRAKRLVVTPAAAAGECPPAAGAGAHEAAATAASESAAAPAAAGSPMRKLVREGDRYVMRTVRDDGSIIVSEADEGDSFAIGETARQIASSLGTLGSFVESSLTGTLRHLTTSSAAAPRERAGRDVHGSVRQPPPPASPPAPELPREVATPESLPGWLQEAELAVRSTRGE